ncbi:hypothetical protein, partial [Ralstonia pseudosolanacearum]|uniref:hypothetical protein n=1 Tax=Ralstonia pseudosolanacearum TaxID=1310165 RepID=UPI001E2AC5DC
PGKSRESTQSAGLFTALSVWTVARKRQLAAWRGGFMQQRRAKPVLVRAKRTGRARHQHLDMSRSIQLTELR